MAVDGALKQKIAKQKIARGATALAVAVLCGLSGTAVTAQTAADPNPYNSELERLSPPERAAKLSAYVGFDCIGTKPFLMGVTKAGPAKGYAYWSLECAGAKSYMIQIAPDGEAAAVDCSALKQAGQGRECYKTF
jgi:hypothetical protein